MKAISNYFWLLLLVLLIIHGVSVIQNEWKRKSIHDKGEMVEVKIDELKCSDGIMIFHFRQNLFVKKIDARTCVLFNEGQVIKLKYNPQYADIFLFANERSPNRFILGGLEITLGLIGLIANWPVISFRRKTRKTFRIIS